VARFSKRANIRVRTRFGGSLFVTGNFLGLPCQFPETQTLKTADRAPGSRNARPNSAVDYARLSSLQPSKLAGAMRELAHLRPIVGCDRFLGRDPRSADDRDIRQSQVLLRQALIDPARRAERDPRKYPPKRSQQCHTADRLSWEQFEEANPEIAGSHHFRGCRDPGKVRNPGGERGRREFCCHARAAEKPCPRRAGLHDISGALHRPGADDHLWQLSRDRGNYGER
jgi:hypothetical protein